MKQAREGDRVRIDYTGKLADGTVFDSSLDHEVCDYGDCDADEQASGDCGCGCESGPRELILGEGEMFPQIDEALVGMRPGEKKTFIIPAPDAFGEYDDDKVFTVPRSHLPADLDPEIGAELVLTNEDDEELGVAVVATTDDTITFDANHPLAGEDLIFDVQLIEIV